MQSKYAIGWRQSRKLKQRRAWNWLAVLFLIALAYTIVSYLEEVL